MNIQQWPDWDYNDVYHSFEQPPTKTAELIKSSYKETDQSQQYLDPIHQQYLAASSIKQPIKNAVLQDTFGSSQSHEQFKQFHVNAQTSLDDQKNKYRPPKHDKNKKNRFLLPILTKLNHKIGDKIGSGNDYGHDAKSTDEIINYAENNRTRSYHGVDHPFRCKSNKTKKSRKRIKKPLYLTKEEERNLNIQEWLKFKETQNAPIHNHEYLDQSGRFNKHHSMMVGQENNYSTNIRFVDSKNED